jgi:DNA-binding XRE family transcriptional regulator
MVPSPGEYNLVRSSFKCYRFPQFMCYPNKPAPARRRGRAKDDAPWTKSEFIVRVRRKLNLTQMELGHLLGISCKAVQSYEQGWRPVPMHALSHLLILLSDNQNRTQPPRQPCWKINRCKDDMLPKCRVYQLGTGTQCWALATKMCKVLNDKTVDAANFPFKNCPVVTRLCADL